MTRRGVLAVAFLLALVGCAGEVAEPPSDVSGAALSYTKLSGNCSAGNFDLPAFAVPVWLTVWPCDVAELGEGHARVECWEPSIVTGPRLTVDHTWQHALDGSIGGSASFGGPTCTGEYSTAFDLDGAS